MSPYELPISSCARYLSRYVSWLILVWCMTCDLAQHSVFAVDVRHNANLSSENVEVHERPMLRVSSDVPFATSLATIAVTWSNIINPSRNDWIGVYLECGDGDDETSIHESLRDASHNRPPASSVSPHTYPATAIPLSPRDVHLLYASPVLYTDYILNANALATGSAIFAVAHTHCPFHFRYYHSQSGPESTLPWSRTRPEHVVQSAFVTSSLSLSFLPQQLRPRLAFVGDHGLFEDVNSHLNEESTHTNAYMRLKTQTPGGAALDGVIRRNGHFLGVSSLAVAWSSYMRDGSTHANSGTHAGRPIVQWAPIARLHDYCHGCREDDGQRERPEEGAPSAHADVPPVLPWETIAELIHEYKRAYPPTSVRALHRLVAQRARGAQHARAGQAHAAQLLHQPYSFGALTTPLDNAYTTSAATTFARFVPTRKLRALLHKHRLPEPVPGIPTLLPFTMQLHGPSAPVDALAEYLASTDYHTGAGRMEPGTGHSGGRGGQAAWRDERTTAASMAHVAASSPAPRFPYYALAEEASVTYIPQPRTRARDARADAGVVVPGGPDEEAAAAASDAVPPLFVTGLTSRVPLCPGDASRRNARNYVFPGYTHTATLRALMPNTVYVYRVGQVNADAAVDLRALQSMLDNNEDVLHPQFSGVFWFVTPADLTHNTNGFQRYLASLHAQSDAEYEGYYRFLELSARVTTQAAATSAIATSAGMGTSAGAGDLARLSGRADAEPKQHGGGDAVDIDGDSDRPGAGAAASIDTNAARVDRRTAATLANRHTLLAMGSFKDKLSARMRSMLTQSAHDTSSELGNAAGAKGDAASVQFLSALERGMLRMRAPLPPLTSSAFAKFIILADGGSAGCYHEHASCAHSHLVARAVAEEIEDLSLASEAAEVLSALANQSASAAALPRQTTRALLLSHPLLPPTPQSVLFVGDLAYALGSVHGWARFLQQWAPVARHVPFMVATGNHEYDDYHLRKHMGDITPPQPVGAVSDAAATAGPHSSDPVPSGSGPRDEAESPRRRHSQLARTLHSGAEQVAHARDEHEFSYLDGDAELMRKYLDDSITQPDQQVVLVPTVAPGQTSAREYALAALSRRFMLHGEHVTLHASSVFTHVDASGNSYATVRAAMQRQNARAERNLTIPYVDIAHSESGGECGVPLATLYSMPKSYAPLPESRYYVHNDINQRMPAHAHQVDMRTDRFYRQYHDIRDEDDHDDEDQAEPATEAAAQTEGERRTAEAAGVPDEFAGYFSSTTAEVPHTVTSNPPFWYSYNVGHVHVVVLSSEHDVSPKSQQRLWLLADLQHTVHRHRLARRRYRASLDAGQHSDAETLHDAHVPFIVVAIHRPLYCSGARKTSAAKTLYLRHELEPLLTRFRVDAVVSGHFHSYERTCPLLAGVCTSQYVALEDYAFADLDELRHSSAAGASDGYSSGSEARLRPHEVYVQPPPADVNCQSDCDSGLEYGIVHITAGTAGVELSRSPQQPEPFSHYYDQQSHGYLRISSVGSYALTIEFVAVSAVYGKVIADSVSIVREWAAQDW